MIRQCDSRRSILRGPAAERIYATCAIE